MESVRTLLHSTSSRSPHKSYESITDLLRTHSIPNEINHFSGTENEDNQSSSSDKLSSQNVKSFFLSHPPSTAVLHKIPIFRFEVDTCSGLSTSDEPNDSNIAASAFESIAAARSFTNHSSPKHRRVSILSNDSTRSWVAQQNPHQNLVLTPPIRRSKSYRYPARIRKHSVKIRHSIKTSKRRPSEVNRLLTTNIIITQLIYSNLFSTNII